MVSHTVSTVTQRPSPSDLKIDGYQPSRSAFGAPFIDIDDWRDVPRRHRHVHGGFEGTDTRFSFYFCPAEFYQGRYFQFLEGGAGGHENLLGEIANPAIHLSWLYDVGFDDLGGYLVESNQGHFPGAGLATRDDGTAEAQVYLFDASAETALFGAFLAEQIYGTVPHHGYLWGISGGGLRTVYGLENRPDVWAGGAPHCGVHNATQWSSWGLAWLVARKKFPQIIDAMEPGGSGDPFTGLSHLEREAVADLYRRGWPRGAENQLSRFMAWAYTMYGVMGEDPEYFRDFWTKPGYLGADDPQQLEPYIIQEKTTVRRTVAASGIDAITAQMHVRFATAGAAGSDPSFGAVFDLDLEADPERLFMSKVSILTGAAKGRELLISDMDGDIVSPFSEITPDVFEDVAPGDEVLLDNRDFVAFCFYHRYAVEGMIPSSADLIPRELDPWTVDGRAVYPQRPRNGRPGQATGKFEGKMLYVQPTLDAEVWNTTISGYERLVHEVLGDGADDQFRLYFVENACHGAPDLLGPILTSEKDPGVWLSRLVSYDGASAQALRDLVAWVEEGTAPTFYNDYAMTRDNALYLPPTAAGRGGIQPVVTASVNGGVRADVKVGQAVSFLGRGEQPPGMGGIVAAEWDLEGRGRWEQSHPGLGGDAPDVELGATHAYQTPGVYFASFRVGAHRDGSQGRGLPVQNLARVRVVVTA